MKKMNCRDVGQECDYVITGQNDDEVIRKAREHARKHGIVQWTEALEQRVRQVIRAA
jgi:predicted small metal-binding protein